MSGWLDDGEKVAWTGGRGDRRRRSVGVVVAQVLAHSGKAEIYIVKVSNRRHGGRRHVRLYRSQLARATIIDEVAALAASEEA